ncbi:MAG: DnaJ domain-containing protein [Alphaproteobacteria bacterium]|nr:DnaJ domain-containing protein [Alphaproteobacteria bacterium]
MTDLYQTLGVSKSASAAEIKKAYHKLARTCHPDVTKNDPKAAEKFKEISAAYDILGDETKRRQYDAGEIDEQGKPRAPFGFGGGSGYQQYGGNPFTGRSYSYQDMGGAGGFEGFDFSDLFGGGGAGGFADLFSNMGRAAGSKSRRPMGQDVSYSLTIDFVLAMTGGETSVRLSNGKQIKVKIPAGIADGATLRLRGQGQNGGDALIKINVASHPHFKRNGNDVEMTLPITLKEAVLGAKVTIPTLTGAVALTIPPNTSSDKILRLKGKGVPNKGDLLVRVQVLLPDHPDEDLENFVKSWKPKSQNPRPFF